MSVSHTQAPSWGDSAVEHSELLGMVESAFAATGPLARADVSYLPRQAQQQMAMAVAKAVDERGVLVVEAGTGVGKTFGYLVPSLLSGARTLISTATKSLQDQLYLRDLPRLRDALQVPVHMALLKGRSSYLCLHRLDQARQEASLPDRRSVQALARVERWAQQTKNGDIAEIDGLDDRSPVIPLVTSSRENCLGSDCPQFKQCYVVAARREAMAADVVVVNHHLFFADMALRDSGVAELLPSVEVAIFDEAHQLSEAGVNFLGTILSTGQLLDFARDLLAAGLQHARGLQDWSSLSGICERTARDLRLAAAGEQREVRGALKLRWDERDDVTQFQAALLATIEALLAAAKGVEGVVETAPDFARLHERATELAEIAKCFQHDVTEGSVRWIDLTPNQARFVESPLDIAAAMQEQIQGGPKAWIFTSATLGDDDALSWFTEPTGLQAATALRVGSPFDYAAHAKLYVPRGFPKPSEATHPDWVAEMAARCGRALGGRTFVLTTTLRALRSIGEALVQRFEEAGDDITVLVQGVAPKRVLLERFLQQPRSVLVGSQSFWEGIDVPGQALQCVIIDKLPFPPPNDPLVQARVKRLESQGRNAFSDYFVAEAAVSLKQGAGRLIRSETDKGLLVVCDPRMAGMHYGRRLRQALPPFGQVANEGEAMEWLQSLAAEHQS